MCSIEVELALQHHDTLAFAAPLQSGQPLACFEPWP